MAQLLNHASALLRDVPLPKGQKLLLRIVPREAARRTGNGDADGWAVEGTGRINLVADVFDVPEGGYRDGHLSPVSATVAHPVYALTYEWGHTQFHPDMDPAAKKAFVRHGPPSAYGGQDPWSRTRSRSRVVPDQRAHDGRVGAGVPQAVRMEVPMTQDPDTDGGPQPPRLRVYVDGFAGAPGKHLEVAQMTDEMLTELAEDGFAEAQQELTRRHPH